jgi:hypothetical protein
METIKMTTKDQVLLEAISVLGNDSAKLIGGTVAWETNNECIILKRKAMSCEVIAKTQGTAMVTVTGKTIIYEKEEELTASVVVIVQDRPLADTLTIKVGEVRVKTEENRNEAILPPILIGI